MKRLIYNIMILTIVSLWVSCTEDDSVWKDYGGRSLKLQFTDGLLLSRAVDDTESERAIKHLDIFIFDKDHQNLIYERIDNPVGADDDNQGTVTLRSSLSDFEKREKNYVYVVANATASFTGEETWEDLKAKIQEDENIHMTGIGLSGMPTHFLMDGKAANETPSDDGSVTISANAEDDITLKVVLKRAAAKVVVTLKQGQDYKLLQDVSNYNRGYYFRNMPYKSTLLDLKDSNGEQIYPSNYLRTPNKANDQVSFNWGNESVVVTGYLYSHKWKNGSLEGGDGHYYQTGTSLIVNIPLWHDTNKDNVLDENEEVFLNSYYQIPIVQETTEGSNSWQISRNTLYQVEATINAPGAEDNKEPHKLEKLNYKTIDWKLKEITVGNEVHPKYLEVNKSLLEMHNVATDATLEFTSSSPITSVTISNAYYINKYGNEIGIEDYKSNGMSTDFDKETLTGTITVKSNVPTNFTARYFTLTVTNADGETKTIDVIQYPVICVSNQLGWYSYREDFKNSNGRVMNFENQYSKGYVGVDSEVRNGKYQGNKYYSSVNGFFKSKVRRTANNDGTYSTYYYTGSSQYDSRCESNANVRIYQINVKATSAEYVVGKPRMIDGVTDASPENQKLVSSSFMIASRLGLMHQGTSYDLADLNNGGSGGLQYDKKTKQLIEGSINNRNVFTPNNNAYDMNNDELLKAFKDHCANYVEVVEVPGGKSIVYDNWRLPTAAEVQFIIDTQGTGNNNEAIDYLLNGGYYYSACGPIYNSKHDNTSKFARCVRDVN